MQVEKKITRFELRMHMEWETYICEGLKENLK